MRLSEAERRGIGIATSGWLAVAIVLYAVSSIGTSAKTSPDERATAGLIAARDAMADYKRDNGSYRNVTAAKLRRLNPAVPAALEEPVTFDEIYALSLTAPSGVTYRLGIGTGGRETHECSVPPGVPPGECRLSSQGSTTGSW